MSTQFFPFEAVGKFSANDIAYAKGNNGLENFYRYTPGYSDLEQALEDRKKYPVDRELLVSEIKRQYEAFSTDAKVFERIEKLKAGNTFTIITAHQPNLLTGPLYFIYKCLSAIRVARELGNRQKEHRIQPVMVLGGEDHDFEELNHLSLFGKKVAWEDRQGGPIGRYSTDSLQPVLEEVYEILGESDHAQILIGKIRKAFTYGRTYGEAMQHFVHELLGHLGILIVSMDNRAFKKKMIPVFREDLLQHTSHDIVRQVQTAFTEAGFDEQAYVRPINVFYFSGDARLRIEKEADRFVTQDHGKEWSEAELLAELEEHPERFSPNVILRPIYQETIFPNLAYVGGGGEISYWLERKAQFEALKTFYPMLIRRDSFQLISRKDFAALKDWGFTIEDIMKPEHEIIDLYLEKHGREEIDLSGELTKLDVLESEIQTKAETIDPSLIARIGAQFAKFKKDMAGVEKRLKKTEKQSHDKNLKRIHRIVDKLFPDNGLQERSENFMSWYILYGEGFFRQILEAADPFDARMKTLII